MSRPGTRYATIKPVRLDRFIANNTGLTRSLAQRAIKRHRVQVNAKVAHNIALKVSAQDQILLDDKRIRARSPQYLMLHKPCGYVCTHQDASHPNIFSLIAEQSEDNPALVAADLHVAGRLDQDTTGLVLLTDDGNWSHRVTSPRHDKAKLYRVDLAAPLSPEDIASLEQGLQLRNEKSLTAVAQVTVLSELQITLNITEGKYHQVKRMLAAVGNRVTGLHREQIGPLKLDPELEPGAFRPLSPSEVQALA